MNILILLGVHITGLVIQVIQIQLLRKSINHRQMVIDKKLTKI